MTFPLILALLIGAPTESIISAQGASAWASLSREEKLVVERLVPQADICTSTECREQTFQSIAQIIKLRRSANGLSMSDPTSNRLKRSCDEHEGELLVMLQCLRARQNVSFEDGMRLAGYTQAGITSEGYAQLRIGMEMREVEYILDDYGEEMSYVSSGGYSASAYQWTAGRGIIIVSFADYKVSGRSQSGLYR